MHLQLSRKLCTTQKFGVLNICLKSIHKIRTVKSTHHLIRAEAQTATAAKMPCFVIHWHAYFPTGLFYLLPGSCLPCSKFDVSGYQFIPTWNKEKCMVRDKQHHTIKVLVLKSCSCSQAERQHLGQCPGWSQAGDLPSWGLTRCLGSLSLASDYTRCMILQSYIMLLNTN